MVREENKHIEPAELYDFVAGQTGEARRQEIRQHVDGCGICRAELALAESFQDQAVDTPLAPEIAARLDAELGTGLGTAQARRMGWRVVSGRPTWVRTGLIAASLVCVLLGINALREPSLPEGTSGELRAVQPGVEWDLHLSEAGAERIQVAWSAVEGAGEYEIRLQSAAGKVLHSERVMASPGEIAIEALPASVREERFLFVTVVALMPDGTRQATRPYSLPGYP